MSGKNLEIVGRKTKKPTILVDKQQFYTTTEVSNKGGSGITFICTCIRIFNV